MHVIHFPDKIEHYKVVKFIKRYSHMIECELLAANPNGAGETEKVFFSLAVWNRARELSPEQLGEYVDADIKTPEFERMLKGEK